MSEQFLGDLQLGDQGQGSVESDPLDLFADSMNDFLDDGIEISDERDRILTELRNTVPHLSRLINGFPGKSIYSKDENGKSYEDPPFLPWNPTTTLTKTEGTESTTYEVEIEDPNYLGSDTMGEIIATDKLKDGDIDSFVVTFQKDNLTQEVTIIEQEEGVYELVYSNNNEEIGNIEIAADELAELMGKFTSVRDIGIGDIEDFVGLVSEDPAFTGE